MTPEEAHQWLEEREADGMLTIEEADLDPDDPRMGRAQFLFTPVADEEELEQEFEGVELDY